jgi:hypothetical protein
VPPVRTSIVPIVAFTAAFMSYPAQTKAAQTYASRDKQSALGFAYIMAKRPVKEKAAKDRQRIARSVLDVVAPAADPNVGGALVHGFEFFDPEKRNS